VAEARVSNVGMADLASASINIDTASDNIIPDTEIDKDLSKSDAVDEVSDVSSNELSGPEDGECESDEEIKKPRKGLLTPPLLNSKTKQFLPTNQTLIRGNSVSFSPQPPQPAAPTIVTAPNCEGS